MAAPGLARRWANVSLRAKITGVTVFILTLGLIVAGAGTLSFLRPQLIAQQDATLQQLRSDPTAALAEGADVSSLKRKDVLYAADTFYVAVIDVEGNVLYDNFRGENHADGPLVPIISADRADELDDTILPLSDSSSDATWRGILTPITSSDTPNEISGYMLIASSTETIDGIMARYITIFSGFGIAVVLLGGALTRILVTSTFEPLTGVERTASEIAEGDLSQRISVTSPNTEVGRLGTSLNMMLDRIDDAFDERARTIEQMRRFVGDASHELRTPLVSVRGYAELYRMGGLESKEELGQAMERIEKEAIRMGTLVEDLLALARLDERRPLQLKPVYLLPLARDAALDAMAQSPERSVTVINNGSLTGSATVAMDAAALKAAKHEAADLNSPTPSSGAIALAGATLARLRSLAGKLNPGSAPGSATGTPAKAADSHAAMSTTAEALHALSDTDAARLECEPIVLADEDKIRQVLNNLIGNSLRYTPADSPIEIVITPRPFEHVTRIEVVDHGDGIPEQIRSKIFERFWRADTSRNRETGGSGLGLAIVSSIVAAHHGKVSAHDTPGGGATFRVDLPLADGALTESALTESDAADAGSAETA